MENHLNKFDTIEDFWRYFNNIPKPTEFFKKDETTKYINDKYIHSWSIFREGIEPAWEDERNINGGEVNLRSFSSMEEIDKLWEHCIVVVLGEMTDYSKNITGIRVVDSSNHYKFMHRIEIWYDSIKIEEKIKKDVYSIFEFPKKGNIIYKGHK